jgi:hypothetical protein
MRLKQKKREQLSPRDIAFANAIADGHKLADAHKLAGFADDKQQAWHRRHRPDIAAKVQNLLDERVKASTRSFVRRSAKAGDLQQRALARLEAIAFTDIREIAQWDKRPIINADGEVTGYEEHVAMTPSAKLSPASAASIKGIIAKFGHARIELHDQRQALVDILKITGAFADDKPAPTNVTVNQLNVGVTTSIEAARKVAFLIRQAAAMQSGPPMIEGKVSASDFQSGDQPAKQPMKSTNDEPDGQAGAT